MNTELTKGFVDFIDDNRLQSLIHDTKEDPAVYREILKKSLSKQPLTVEETAALIAVNSPEGLHEIFETAREAQALGLRQPHRALRTTLHRQLLHQ